MLSISLRVYSTLIVSPAYIDRSEMDVMEGESLTPVIRIELFPVAEVTPLLVMV